MITNVLRTDEFIRATFKCFHPPKALFEDYAEAMLIVAGMDLMELLDLHVGDRRNSMEELVCGDAKRVMSELGRLVERHTEFNRFCLMFDEKKEEGSMVISKVLSKGNDEAQQ